MRTHGTRKGTTVFETVPIDHSGTSPQERYPRVREGVDGRAASNPIATAPQAPGCAPPTPHYLWGIERYRPTLPHTTADTPLPTLAQAHLHIAQVVLTPIF